jgi:hypothetical protein
MLEVQVILHVVERSLPWRDAGRLRARLDQVNECWRWRPPYG